MFQPGIAFEKTFIVGLRNLFSAARKTQRRTEGHSNYIEPYVWRTGPSRAKTFLPLPVLG